MVRVQSSEFRVIVSVGVGVLFFGRSATRRAFRYIFARLISPRSPILVPKSHSPFPNPISHHLAKDAAPIPNAKGLLKIIFQLHKALPHAIYVTPFQGLVQSSEFSVLSSAFSVLSPKTQGAPTRSSLLVLSR